MEKKGFDPLYIFSVILQKSDLIMIVFLLETKFLFCFVLFCFKGEGYINLLASKYIDDRKGK